MVAGPNGSGKTTLTRWLRERGIDFGEYINPDDIALELEGSYDARVAQAQILADRRRDALIAAKQSFSFETVMSHPSKIDILMRAKAAGFFVQLYFVATDDPQTNVERVALRVAQGGHDVPEDRIVARWHRTMGYLAQAVAAVDQANIFDNSDSEGAAGPRFLLRVESRPGAQIVSAQFPPIPAWAREYLVRPLRLSGVRR